MLLPIPKPGSPYTTEQIELALQALAVHGSPTATQKALEEQHNLKLSTETLKKWRDVSYPERYAEVSVKYAPAVAARIAAKHEELALVALDQEINVMERMAEDIESRKIYGRDLAPALTAIHKAAKGHSDTAQLYRGRPTAITQQHAADTERIAEELAKAFPGVITLVEDTEAEDIEEATVIDPGKQA